MLAENQYLETKVLTATPWQLHMMVVDAAIRKATKAQQALRERDFETAHFCLNNSRDCITELIGGLNAEHQPELAERLKSLFAFTYRRLAEADMHHDSGRVEDALRVLGQHRETWKELGEQLRRDNTETVAYPAPQEWES
jgi:flagellar protein FliS